MGTYINLVFFGVSFIALSISGGFATDSARRVTGISGWDKNPDLSTAHKYLSIAAVVCWITVAAIIVGGILYIWGTAETIELGSLGWAGYMVYGLLFLSLAATIVVGILSALGAQKIANSKVTNDNNSRRQAIIAAVLALVTAVGLIAALITMFAYHGSKKKKDTSTESELQTLALMA